MEAVALVRHGVLGIAPVQGVAGEAWMVAEVLPALAAVAADPAGVAQPRHPDAVADPEFFHPRPHGGHRAGNLMTEDQGQFGLGQLPVHDMQIGAADPAGPHPDEHLLRAGPGNQDFLRPKRLPRRLQ